MDCLLGVDLGSTSLKAVIYDTAGQLVARGDRPTERFHPNPQYPEWTVWQPEQIWGGTAAAIRDAVNQIGDSRQIRAVAVTGMGMDGLPVDEHGHWLYPMISWLDPRTTPQLDWWTQHVGLAKTFSIGGNPVWPINSALRMLWMVEHEPQVMARAQRWLLIEDFVNFMLCGRQITDYSMASCTMLFDQRSLTWSEELLALSGLDRRLLCTPQPSGTPIGEVTAEAAALTGLPVGTPVVLGGHDHLCGALPVGAFRPGVVLDVTGTWEIVMVTIPRPVLDPRLQPMGVTIQSHVASGVHAAWGAAVAAEMLEWYRKQLVPAEASRSDTADWQYLMEAASEAPPGAHGVMFLPHMNGAACPMVDAKSLGAFVGLNATATRNDLLRAVVEGLAYQFRDIVAAMESGLGTSCTQFIAVGGATRNAFWMQNKADVVGRTLEVPAIEEATPLGAAILAGIGAGLYADVEDAYRRIARPGRVYHPDPQRASQYAHWFDNYRQLYPSLTGVHHRLFDTFLTR